MEDDEDENGITAHQISPPPTPINRFLESVNIYKRNQIRVAIPRFILRGLGRNAYHVFEVKVCHTQFDFYSSSENLLREMYLDRRYFPKHLLEFLRRVGAKID